MAVVERELRARTGVYEATDKRLHPWGGERNRASRSLGCPGTSTIAMMIDKVKVFEQQRKGVKKKAIRKVAGKRPWDVDAKVAAQEFGYIETAQTAGGKESFSINEAASRIQFSSDVMSVEAVVQRLDGQMKAIIYRSYLWKQ